jgi:hypothetical protein
MNGVKIKPLAWHNFDAWTWWAEAVCGTYCIDERNGAWKAVLRFHDAAHPITEVSNFDNAISAAQADYDARIISALDPEALARWREEAVQAEREEIADLLEIIFAASDGIELRLGGTSETITLTEIVATIRARKGGAA